MLLQLSASTPGTQVIGSIKNNRQWYFAQPERTWTADHWDPFLA
jgi:hypothetical protein